MIPHIHLTIRMSKGANRGGYYSIKHGPSRPCYFCKRHHRHFRTVFYRKATRRTCFYCYRQPKRKLRRKRRERI